MNRCLLAAGLMILLPSTSGWAESGEAGYYPLAKGNRWTYQAVVGWTKDRPAGSEAPPEVVTEKMSWTVEVQEIVERGSVLAARMHGSVRDLTWYETGKKPSDWLLVKVGANHYHEITENVDETWKAIVESENGGYLEQLTEGNLVLEVPLTLDARWGEFAQTPRGDYCYLVDAEAAFDPSAIKGAPVLNRPQVFTILFRTRPDHQVIEFVPHLGIVGYEYGHHGTVSNVKAKLVEFNSGQP